MQTDKKKQIAVYGFEKLGFTLPTDPVAGDSYEVFFLKFGCDESFDQFDALILPSGIFETFQNHRGPLGHSFTTVDYPKAYLAEREKQILNCIKKDWWGAFLIGKVVMGREPGDKSFSNSDLAKKILGAFFGEIRAHDPQPYVNSKCDEFRKYFDRWGICRTDIGYPNDDAQTRVLGESRSRLAAAEYAGKYFFLPFSSTKLDRDTLVSAVRSVVDSVIEYKKKNDIYIPEWVSNISFAKEQEIENHLVALQEEILKLDSEKEVWGSYKAVLTTSGENLRKIFVSILKEFYELKTKDVDEFVEDAQIVDKDDNPFFVVEAKGINSGLKREHINQVDSHRERLGLDDKVPGLLILNDFMRIEGFEERKAKKFDEAHLRHAVNLNVRILRTVSLIELMLAHEKSDARGQLFLEACNNAQPLILPK